MLDMNFWRQFYHLLFWSYVVLFLHVDLLCCSKLSAVLSWVVQLTYFMNDYHYKKICVFFSTYPYSIQSDRRKKSTQISVIFHTNEMHVTCINNKHHTLFNASNAGTETTSTNWIKQNKVMNGLIIAAASYRLNVEQSFFLLLTCHLWSRVCLYDSRTLRA